MNKYLKSAINRYEELKSGKTLIHPISEIDVNIIERLIHLFNNKEITSIMEVYKFEKDEDILKRLAEVKLFKPIEKIKSIIGEIEEPKKKVDVIELDGEMIKLKEIYGVKSLDTNIYSKDTGTVLERFLIILNPLPDIDVSRVPLYADYKLEFDYEEDRDRVYDYIRENLNNNYNLTKL